MNKRINTQGKTYKCEKCKEEFRYYNSLRQHNRICGKLKKLEKELIL